MMEQNNGGHFLQMNSYRSLKKNSIAVVHKNIDMDVEYQWEDMGH